MNCEPETTYLTLGLQDCQFETFFFFLFRWENTIWKLLGYHNWKKMVVFQSDSFIVSFKFISLPRKQARHCVYKPVFLEQWASFSLYDLSVVKFWPETGMSFQHLLRRLKCKVSYSNSINISKQVILIHKSNCLHNHLASKKTTNLHKQARLSEV